MSSTPTLLPSSATPRGSPSFDLSPSQFDRPSPSSPSEPTRSRTLYERIGSPGSGMLRDMKGVRFDCPRKEWEVFVELELTPLLAFLPLSQRAPFYVSDWTDAWNYRVIPSTAFVFFSNVLVSLERGRTRVGARRADRPFCLSRLVLSQPGIAFSLDLIETTGKYGVNEVLLSSKSESLFHLRRAPRSSCFALSTVSSSDPDPPSLARTSALMAAGVFSLFGAQPLVISGVTGESFPLVRLPFRSRAHPFFSSDPPQDRSPSSTRRSSISSTA